MKSKNNETSEQLDEHSDESKSFVKRLIDWVEYLPVGFTSRLFTIYSGFIISMMNENEEEKREKEISIRCEVTLNSQHTIKSSSKFYYSALKKTHYWQYIQSVTMVAIAPIGIGIIAAGIIAILAKQYQGH